MCLFKKNKKVKTEHKNENIKLAKLITVKNNYELGIIESILTDNKILGSVLKEMTVKFSDINKQSK